MGNKIGKGKYPAGHSANDFKCFGPPSVKDGDFSTCKMADMGCFTQDGKDSNKFYHAAMCQSNKDKSWWVYFEWGRTGRSNSSFQFVQCNDEYDAQSEFAKQLMDKNVKRGEWIDIGGIRTLRAKAGKDCYLVRSLTTRNIGLPDGRTIQINDGHKQTPIVNKSSVNNSASTFKADAETISLMRDLNVVTIDYARSAMSSDTLPTQSSIDDARILLTEALNRVNIVGDNLKSQISDKALKQLTYELYSRIPKRKAIGSHESTWVLSSENIFAWQQDLNAFESALYSRGIVQHNDVNPFGDLKIDMRYVERSSKLGEWLYEWWPGSTSNRHSHLANMNIRHIWSFERHDDIGKIERIQNTIAAKKLNVTEYVPHQPVERFDLDKKENDLYKASNTALLFHGTRSVNVSGILRKSILMPKNLVGVAITGAMFGPGLYFADDWKKSAGYTSLSNSHWAKGAGTVSDRRAFMFAADVVLGSPYVAPGPRGYTSPPSGHHSVFGKAGHSQVFNNEWIVFSEQQNKLRYLVEFGA